MLQKQNKLGDEESEMDINMDDGDLDFEGNRLEEKIADDFLNKFVIISESSTLDHINIIIMLKAIPNQIVDYNLE